MLGIIEKLFSAADSSEPAQPGRAQRPDLDGPGDERHRRHRDGRRATAITVAQPLALDSARAGDPV